MRIIFRNTLFKKGAAIQKFRFALYFMDYLVIDLDLGRNKSWNIKGNKKNPQPNKPHSHNYNSQNDYKSDKKQKGKNQNEKQQWKEI